MTKKYEKTKIISKDRAEYINTLLKLTGDKIYDKYGLKRDDTVTETVVFDNGVEMDIKLVICDEDGEPYTEAVLFDKNGSQMAYTDAADEFLGTWTIEYENGSVIEEYTAFIETASDTKNKPSRLQMLK